MKNTPIDNTDLLWLADLARALIRDSSAADDLVQDTMAAALNAPLPPDAPRRAWLGSVARRLAAKRFRSEGRRQKREQHAARPEARPSTSDLVERAELAEKVAAATRRLPEPFRETILLRFLEGQSPEDIAKRDGSPADTVRWRVRRGIELLREELLKEDDRNWSSWCVLLAPLAHGGRDIGTASAGATGTLKGFLMTGALTMKMMTIAVTVMIGTSLWLMYWDSGTNDDFDVGTITIAEDASSPNSARRTMARVPEVDTSRDNSARTGRGIESMVPQKTLVDGPGLGGRIVDENGVPVPGATVYLVPAGPGNTGKRPKKNMIPSIRTTSDTSGMFHIAEAKWKDPSRTLPRPSDLGVVANGFRRRVLPGLVEGSPRSDIVVVLERGLYLRGRVVDVQGKGIPGLELLAYTATAGIDHVTPSQVLLGAERAWMGGASSQYENARAVTDRFGRVVFSGLANGNVRVHCLNPAWLITGPSRPEAGVPDVLWTAHPALGVQLDVRDAGTGEPVDRAYAIFGAILEDDKGNTEKASQWVGRGKGGVSFRLHPGLYPPLKEKRFVRATFFGKVRCNGIEVPWRAEPLENPEGASGVAKVRVLIDLDADGSQSEKSNADSLRRMPAPKNEPPPSALELDVRFSNGTPFEGRLVVNWSIKAEKGRSRSGKARIKPESPGYYRLSSIPPGSLSLVVKDEDASGSLAPWVGQVRCYSGLTGRVQIRLPIGAAATVMRPYGWTGEWFLHASYRLGDSDAWRGSWNHSTREGSLRLSALEPAEWRFRLTQKRDGDKNPIILTINLADGNDATVRE